MSSSPLPPEQTVTLFLDRTHQSKQTVKLLKALGVPVEVHRNHFDHDAPDDFWIPKCAANGWVIITEDQGIENDGINRAAVIRSGAKVFILSAYKAKGLEITAALLTARKAVAQIALKSVGPFYCPIAMVGDKHVSTPKFYQGGYAVKEENVEAAICEEENAKPSRRRRKQPKQTSESFDFA